MKKTKQRRSARLAWRLFLLSILASTAIGLWAVGRVGEAGRGSTWLSLLLAPVRPAGHVGLVAGHRGNDSGTVCPDDLTEAAVNLGIAESAAATLRRQGFRVDLLDEFDPRLAGYRADALVAIHADSCSVDLSGFKVASPTREGEMSDRLAVCLWDEYAQATSLPTNPDTITEDMLQYHAFREIAATTPAAIIEVGFLSGDRVLLTQHADVAAAGIVQGVTCFLEQR